MPRYVRFSGDTIIKYPYKRSDFVAEYPNASVPKNPTAEQLAEFGVAQVVETTPPANDINFNLVEGVEKVGNEFRQTWTQVPASQEEIDERTESERLQTELEDLRNDPVVRQLMRASPAQIDNYVDNNVTALADVQREIKQIYKILAPVLRNELA